MNIDLNFGKLPELVTKILVNHFHCQNTMSNATTSCSSSKNIRPHLESIQTWSRSLFFLKARSQLFDWALSTPLIRQKSGEKVYSPVHNCWAYGN